MNVVAAATTHQRIRFHNGMLSCLRRRTTAALRELQRNVLEDVAADRAVRTLLSTA